jgi:hypothetical protein
MEPIQLEGCAGGYFCHPQVPVLTYHSSVSDPDPNSNGSADPVRPKLSPKKGKKEEILCLKCFLLGWRLLEPI